MPFDSSDYVVASPQVALPVDPVLANLVKARALISNKENWLQGDYCRADQYCALGAIKKVGRYQDDVAAEREIRLLRAAIPGGKRKWVHLYNDRHTHEEVLALFDRAISARRAEIGG